MNPVIKIGCSTVQLKRRSSLSRYVIGSIVIDSSAYGTKSQSRRKMRKALWNMIDQAMFAIKHFTDRLELSQTIYWIDSLIS